MKQNVPWTPLKGIFKTFIIGTLAKRFHLLRYIHISVQPLCAKFFTYFYSQSDLHAFMSKRAQQDEISVTFHCSAEASCLHQLLNTDILFNRSIIQLLIVLEFL